MGTGHYRAAVVAIVEGEGTENTKEDQEESEETIAEEEEPNYEDQHQHGPYLHQVQHIKLILLIGRLGPLL